MSANRFRKLRQSTAVLVFAIAVVAVLILTMESFAAATVSEPGNVRKNYLVFCLDDTGYNTDAILLVGLNLGNTEATFLQLPRDTYFESGDENRKLNGLWYRYYSESGDKTTASRRFAAFISQHFSVPVDGSILLTTGGVASVIDAMGGVTLDIDADMYYSDPAQDLEIRLPAGKHRLSGADAVKFARYRYAYLTGDLGRLDAQKMLMAALFREAENFSAGQYARVATTLWQVTDTDIPLRDILGLGIVYLTKKSDVALRFLTLPGDATQYNGTHGVWYYSLNRKSAGKVTEKYFGGNAAAFDINGSFCGDTDPMKKIYYDDSQKIVEYSIDNIWQIKIATTK